MLLLTRLLGPADFGVYAHLAADRQTAREVLAFGAAYSPVTLVPKVSLLASPVIVRAIAGPAGVGFVALATWLVQTAGFIGRTAYRTALVVLAQIKDNAPRMARAFREGLGLQALGAGVPVAALCVISLVLVPLAFGEQSRPALTVAVRRISPPRYDEAPPWLVGLGPVMFVPTVTGPAALLLGIPLVVVLARPASRRQLQGVIGQVRQSLSSRSAESVGTA